MPNTSNPIMLLDLSELLAQVKCGKASVYRHLRDPNSSFPKPVKIGGRNLWVEREVQAYIAGLVAARNADARRAARAAARAA